MEKRDNDSYFFTVKELINDALEKLYKDDEPVNVCGAINTLEAAKMVIEHRTLEESSKA